jgi:signal peptidase I
VRSLLLSSVRTLLVVLVVMGLAWSALQYWRPLRVAGGSMRPALSPGDLVIVDTRSPAALDQIALLRSPRHGLVLHRVTAVQGDGSVRTRGDANAIEDFDASPASSVIGPVVLVAPVGRLIERWRGSAACDTMTAQ